MDRELLYNGSGYVDPTAHDALRKIQLGGGRTNACLIEVKFTN